MSDMTLGGFGPLVRRGAVRISLRQYVVLCRADRRQAAMLRHVDDRLRGDAGLLREPEQTRIPLGAAPWCGGRWPF